MKYISTKQELFELRVELTSGASSKVCLRVAMLVCYRSRDLLLWPTQPNQVVQQLTRALDKSQKEASAAQRELAVSVLAWGLWCVWVCTSSQARWTDRTRTRQSGN